MAKVTPAAHPGSSAGGWKGGPLGGWPRRLCVWKPHNPKSVANVLPRCGKMAKSSSCSDGRAPDPAWERSCSCALVTPLTTTKRHHSASENKICIYATPPITFPNPSLPWFQGSMLQTRRDSSGSLVTSGTSVGVRPLCVTLVKPEARVGQEWGGGVGSRTYTQPHFEA